MKLHQRSPTQMCQGRRGRTTTEHNACAVQQQKRVHCAHSQSSRAGAVHTAAPVNQKFTQKIVKRAATGRDGDGGVEERRGEVRRVPPCNRASCGRGRRGGITRAHSSQARSRHSAQRTVRYGQVPLQSQPPSRLYRLVQLKSYNIYLLNDTTKKKH